MKRNDNVKEFTIKRNGPYFEGYVGDNLVASFLDYKTTQDVTVEHFLISIGEK